MQVWAIALFFAALIVLLRSYLTLRNKKGLEELTERSKCTALVTIATNGYDASWLVRTARSRGNWKDPIFVVGDDTSERPEGSTYIKVDRPRDSLMAVAIKAQLLDLIDPSIRRFLYLDADMAINRPVHFFLDAIRTWDPGCSAYMIRERWYTKSLWNSGTIMLDRIHSKKLLDDWYTLIEKNHDTILSQKKYSKDQWALMQLLPRYQVCRLPDQVGFMADWWTVHILGHHRSTFTHWTSAKNEAKHSFKIQNEKSALRAR